MHEPIVSAMQTTSDEVLISRIAGGDPLAMQVLYARHHVRVYRFVLRVVRNEATAEDLISEVFLDVWRQAGKSPERQEIEELLPWHAAGTLSRRDAQRVEEALARDPELARRYALVREELGETINLNETLGAPSARALENLFAKIDAEPARQPTTSLNLDGRIGEFLAGLSPRTLAWSATAAALAIVVQAGFLADIMLKETKRTGYETASAPSTDPGVGAFASIRFAPQASSDDVTKFLEANKLSIAAGPMAGGLYKVRVAVTGIPKGELANIVKKLQQDKVVGFIATTE
jgi:hypothetical protein